MRNALESRIAKLEEAAQKRDFSPPKAHSFIQHIGQSREEARARYERDSGAVIGLADLVIVRVIVEPPKLEEWK